MSITGLVLCNSKVRIINRHGENTFGYKKIIKYYYFFLTAEFEGQIIGFCELSFEIKINLATSPVLKKYFHF